MGSGIVNVTSDFKVNCLAIEMEPVKHSYFVQTFPFEKWGVVSPRPQMGDEVRGYSGIRPLWVNQGFGWEGSQTRVWRGSLSSSFLSEFVLQAQHWPPMFYSALLGTKKENSKVTSAPRAWHQCAWSSEKLSCSKVLVAVNWWGFASRV